MTFSTTCLGSVLSANGTNTGIAHQVLHNLQHTPSSMLPGQSLQHGRMDHLSLIIHNKRDWARFCLNPLGHAFTRCTLAHVFGPFHCNRQHHIRDFFTCVCIQLWCNYPIQVNWLPHGSQRFGVLPFGLALEHNLFPQDQTLFLPVTSHPSHPTSVLYTLALFSPGSCKLHWHFLTPVAASPPAATHIPTIQNHSETFRIIHKHSKTFTKLQKHSKKSFGESLLRCSCFSPRPKV